MNKVNGIRIFCILTVLFGIGCYQAMHLKSTKEEQKEVSTEMVFVEPDEGETEEREDAVEAAGIMDYKFVILEEGGYLTVYLADRKTVYEYTGIRWDRLDEGMKEKVKNGYCIENEEILFGILENYSS